MTAGLKACTTTTLRGQKAARAYLGTAVQSETPQILGVAGHWHMDIELEIEGVPDEAIAHAIREKVRHLRHHIALAGDWRVTLAPSETRGEWDLGILAPSGWQLASFAEPVDRLPDVIERKLRECLESNTSGNS